MAALFNRQILLRITDSAGIGREYSSLRIDFHVEHSDASDPSKAKVTAYNLAPDSKAIAEGDGAIVQILVGYEGRTTQQIFAGNVIDGGVSETKQGSDRILTLECQDGGVEIAEAEVDISFATETSLGQIVEECISQLGLARGTVNLPTGYSWPNGVVLQGDARSVLNEITASAGLKWFVRDRAIQVISEGETTGETAPVFSVDEGNLVGSPTGRDDGVKVVALLGGAQNLRPGKPFRISGTEKHDGDYLATDVVFRGSNWSQPFYVEAEGTPL